LFEDYDRGWALQAAVDRNRYDVKHCSVQWHGVPSDLSLERLAKVLNDERSKKVPGETIGIPAFSLNTTVAETGDRLLLANYRVRFQENYPSSELLPALSFLEMYPGTQYNAPPSMDLSLTGAARLSASFPYVSPMARVPRGTGDYPEKAFHFGDGGYADNDGTSTVLEFLAQAYCVGMDQKEGCKPPGEPHQIMLIEIRDGANPTGTESPDLGTKQEHAAIWGSMRQVTAPLTIFYKAGHSSVTRRNRRELCTLEDDLYKGDFAKSHLALKHYVFEFAPRQVRPSAQPLNWVLTPLDKKEIAEELNRNQNYATIIAADFKKLTDTKRISNAKPKKTTFGNVNSGGAQVAADCEVVKPPQP
jgi:hypothetical protein